MKIFNCQSCDQVVYFENTKCTNCGATLGFLPDRFTMTSLEAGHDKLWRPVGAPAEALPYRMCQNYSQHDACNWMVPEDSPVAFCDACSLNQVIPDLSVAGNISLWRRIEAGKRRLVYGLMRLHLPIVSKGENSQSGLAFAFLADASAVPTKTSGPITGHAQGLITINIAEADSALRERMRQEMDEPYRTILGHFRHESGHYYWSLLDSNEDWLAEFREIFGDERADYATAMRNHYEQGAGADWQSNFVSVYASSHAWEDWAETWAHYLHIIDVLETAWVFGLRISPRGYLDETMAAKPDFDPYHTDSVEQVMDHWLPITYAVNSLNRSMGQPDLYPFVLTPDVISKLSFVHKSIRLLAEP